MKLLSLQEASPPVQFPVAQELFALLRKDKRARGRPVAQEDIGKFAAWLDVEINGGDRNDLKRIIYEGIKGLKDNPQGVEDVFVDFLKGYTEDSFFDDEVEALEEARKEALDELVDDFFAYNSGKKRR